MAKVRHVLGISGGKDSAALAIYLKDNYPSLDIEYYNTDTGCELEETIQLVNRLESYLGHIEKLIAAKGSPEPTPFDHYLKVNRGYLPSPQSRWCTNKLKLSEFEDFVGDDLAVSYVGIRGDEEREGYVSTKPNIQSIFPFRRNIWSLDVITQILSNQNIDKLITLYQKFTSKKEFEGVLQLAEIPLTKQFFYSKKLNALLDFNIKLFNRVVFEFLKETDYPIGKLENFPLIDNTEVLVKDDILNILKKSGVGIPSYYNLINFEVDGKVGQYCRSRSGCYFCFFQQKIEWIWLYEQHPDLFQKAMEYEKTGYTWNQGESLVDLIQPERVRQIKLDYLKKSQTNKNKNNTGLLVDIFDDDEINCANCFI
jgi:phosphoadenosine phosphosulfate reductase